MSHTNTTVSTMNAIIGVISIAAAMLAIAAQSDNDVVSEYLTKFGYLTKNEYEEMEEQQDFSKLKNAISQFQQFYNLTNDGQLNEETCALMRTPRCGVEDIPSSYRTAPFPWRKHNITWTYAGGTALQVAIAEKAFETWSNASKLNFRMTNTQADIVISNRRGVHRFVGRRQEVCPNLLDGRGHVLAHAFFPNSNNTPVEIHMDDDEDWKYNGIGRTDFLGVLIHEIGHTLGIEHSTDKNSIMYAYYNGYRVLNSDDITAIQSLYGRRRQVPRTSSTTTTTTTTIAPSSSTTSQAPSHPTPPKQQPPSEMSLCKYLANGEFLRMVIINGRLYILRGNLAWSLPIDDELNNLNQPPLILNDWLTFLPKVLTNITAVYQRPNGEVVMLIDGLLYMFDIHNLKLKYGYPTNATTKYGLPSNSNIQSIINTYTGKTYIIYNDIYFAEIDESLYQAVKFGHVSEVFPSIPMRIDSAFRYANGLIYFFKDNYYYEFNEFSKKLKRSGAIDYTMFGVKCYDSIIMNMFHNILSKFNFIPKQQ